jgi:prevent-host-death family protein
MTDMTRTTNPGDQAMSASTWTIAAAKAKLSEVIELARSRGPQTITRHGRTAAVIVAADEWHWKCTRIGINITTFAETMVDKTVSASETIPHSL